VQKVQWTVKTKTQSHGILRSTNGFSAKQSEFSGKKVWDVGKKSILFRKKKGSGDLMDKLSPYEKDQIAKRRKRHLSKYRKALLLRNIFSTSLFVVIVYISIYIIINT